MKKLLLFVCTIALFTSLKAQLVTTVPVLPTDQDETTITFDASLGNQGLKDYLGDVYAHTGVTTNLGTWKHVIASWDVNDPKVKMTYLGNNKFQLVLTPSIRAFYNVPAEETITQLDFVFRSGDRTKEGKTATNGDIFVDVYKVGLAVAITSPDVQPYFVDAASNFNIHVAGSIATAVNVKIDDNPIPVYTETSTPNSFDYNVSVATSGTHKITVEATDGNTTVSDNFYYAVRSSTTVEALPIGVKDGINYIDDNTITLVLHAPYKNSVYAYSSFNDWQPLAMKRTDANINNIELRYWVTLSGLTPGQEYFLQYIVDENLKIADPYSEKISDPWNDKYITTETYPDLIAYPEGKTDGIASVFQTAQAGYSWQAAGFVPPKVEDLVIYELLVRDFAAKADYQTLVDTVGYFKRLGINAIELMPINEFDGNDSWGYNPAFYFAPDKAYGTKNKLKEFIDICHQNGIAVLVDLVLNHSYGQSPLVQLYFDKISGKPTAQNLWYNITSPNTTYSWGYDFNHQSLYTKQFVDSVNSYWLTNYKVDGFRFDFTKGFTNTPGDGWAYDASRIAILERIYDKIKIVNPNAYMILEHLTENSEETTLSNYGMLLWGNMNYNYSQASQGYTANSDLSWGSYEQRGWTKPHLVSYMESHDEERLMYNNKTYGNSSGSYDVRDLKTALSRIELAASFFFTIPGPKMMWQFGELGYDISINYLNDRVGKKPIKWEYYSQTDRFRLYQVFSALIKLKESQAVFETSDFTIELTGGIKLLHLNSADLDVTVIGNFGVSQSGAIMKMQHIGTWYDYFTGNPIEILDVNQQTILAPGEYHIYTSVQLDKPDIVSDVENINKNNGKTANLKAFPNPAQTSMSIDFNLEETAKNAEISIFNLGGQKVATLHKGQMSKGEQHFEWNLNNSQGQKVASGAYLLKMESDKVNENLVLIVK